MTISITSSRLSGDRLDRHRCASVNLSMYLPSIMDHRAKDSGEGNDTAVVTK